MWKTKKNYLNFEVFCLRLKFGCFIIQQFLATYVKVTQTKKSY